MDPLGESCVFPLEHWQPALGWRARIPLAEGLTSTVAEFRSALQLQLVRI